MDWKHDGMVWRYGHAARCLTQVVINTGKKNNQYQFIILQIWSTNYFSLIRIITTITIWLI